jgi:hypothetical protein
VLEHRNPVEVLAILRTAQQLLDQASVQDYSGGSFGAHYRALLDSAADLNALAREIAAEAELD